MICRKDKLIIKTYPTREEMGKDAAFEAISVIRDFLSYKKEVNIIFAAAPSQDDFLTALSQYDAAWRLVNAFHMDEYIGLEADAPQRFGNYLKHSFFDKVPLKQVFYLGKDSDSQEKEVSRYTDLLIQYPPDIVFLGIGENGHIAFNDPHVANFADPDMVKVVDLDLACRQQQVNDGCFESLSQVPTHAYTLTIPALTKARYMFCIVPTERKAQAVYNTLYGDINESCPASILREQYNATLYLDAESAKLIDNR
jgi:6-phosphogluconolactonase/Glucosamine-6-phosphate isomerase/deaminase